MNIFLLLANEHIGKQLDKTVGRRNWTELRRSGEYLVRAAEQTGEIARRLGITRNEPGLVLPFTVYSGFADARIIETLKSWEDRRRAGE